MKALWNNKVIAESSETVVIEGNHYFPMKDVKREFLLDSDHTTYCPWKGEASYCHIHLEGGDINENAAWYYADPKEAAAVIKGRIAFWKGVKVEE
ncbi:MAG: DUF427 domain-containing protein [Saprospirales bacterium]|nr:MAG: DUF427 domain-containing protein [Saprospirales bacterium]